MATDSILIVLNIFSTLQFYKINKELIVEIFTLIFA